MKKHQLYWARFMSETPVILKKLRNILLAVAAGAGSLSASLVAFDKTAKLAVTFGIIAAICTGIATGLQMSTTDKDLQKQQ